MQPDELILISVDDHICEPPDMFDGHVPERYREHTPRVLTDDDGNQQWWYGEVRGRNLGLNAVAGKPPRDVQREPGTLRGDAAGLLRRPRAGSRHVRRRSARGAELPELARLRGAGVERKDPTGTPTS